MSIFNSGAELAQSEGRCKPDYERAISNSRKERDVTQKLQEAVMDYCRLQGISGPHGKSMTIAELVGMCLLECQAIDRRIADLIQAQEKEKD